jgi:hypothetical protein
MRESAVESGDGRRQPEQISEIDVLWITAGLGWTLSTEASIKLAEHSTDDALTPAEIRVLRLISAAATAISCSKTEKTN